MDQSAEAGEEVGGVPVRLGHPLPPPEERREELRGYPLVRHGPGRHLRERRERVEEAPERLALVLRFRGGGA